LKTWNKNKANPKNKLIKMKVSLINIY